jgi:heme-degrading monooxygenase HmoA
MVARVTLAEIDTVRLSLADAVRHFEDTLLPRLRGQEGYEGGYVLATPDGRALVMTFWRDLEAADAGLATGFYDRQVQEYVTVFRAPPGREHYDVVVADMPVAAGR